VVRDLGFINVMTRISHILIHIKPKCEEIDGITVLESTKGGGVANGQLEEIVVIV
jgi:hypothetical protein